MIVGYVLPYASGSDLPQLQLHQQQNASPGRRSLALEDGGSTVAHQDPDLNLLQDLSTKDAVGALDVLVTELEEQVSGQVSPHNILGNLSLVLCSVCSLLNLRHKSTATGQQLGPVGYV